MKKLTYNFSHPVKELVRLFNLLNPEESRIVPLDTLSELNSDVYIDDLPEGKWKATLEWEHDGRYFFFEEQFEIEDNKASSDSVEECDH